MAVPLELEQVPVALCLPVTQLLIPLASSLPVGAEHTNSLKVGGAWAVLGAEPGSLGRGS